MSRFFSFSILISILLCCFSLSVNANPNKFFANPELQGQAPDAFALSKKNLKWLKLAHQQRDIDAKRFYLQLKSTPELYPSLKNWLNLSFEQRLQLLPKVFEVECAVLQMTCPELVINTTLYPTRPVNFVFDIRHPGSGLVYLNPEKLKEMAPYAPLAFLIHETRHAYQFQMGFSQKDVLAQGYKAAFTAQSKLTGFSFSDFLTLLNEYEAFQFGNHVIGLLTNWQVDMSNMGTFASQFDKLGYLKIDLVQTAEQNPDDLLQAYNELAQRQYKLRQQ